MQPAISAILCLLFLFLHSFGSKAKPQRLKKTAVLFPTASQFANIQLTYKIIHVANNTFYYDMLADGRIFIHQPSNPNLTGNEGFKSKVFAEKVAKLIFTRIKKDEMHLSIIPNELKKLSIL